MKKSVVVLLHVGFWMCYFFLIMIMLGMYFHGAEDSESRIEEAFKIVFIFAIIPSIITFYSFYLVLFPKFLKEKKIIQSIVYGVLISLGAALVGFALMGLIVGNECSDDEGVFTAIGVILFMTFEAMIAGVVALVMNGFIHWFEEIQLKKTLAQKNQEMELALVKSQLDPHFLFNTINNIDVLILKNAAVASDYLNKLSDIMRFMLYETKSDEILLVKEIEYIEKYIELQKIRTANSTYVNFQLNGDPKDKIIAPMIFIPFIENAFKHTNNKKLENAINIDIIIENFSVHFECVNRFDATRKLNGNINDKANGLGNDLIKKRLNLLYPDQHHLEVQHQNDLYRVGLTIELGERDKTEDRRRKTEVFTRT